MLKTLYIIPDKTKYFLVWVISIITYSILNTVLLPAAFANALDNVVNNRDYLNILLQILMLTVTSISINIVQVHLRNSLSLKSAIIIKKHFWNNLQNAENLALLDTDNIVSLYNTVLNDYIEKSYSFIYAAVSVFSILLSGTIYSISTNPIIFLFSLAVSLAIMKINNSNYEKTFVNSYNVSSLKNIKNTKVWDRINNHEIAPFLNQKKIYEGLDRSIDEYESAISELKKSSNSSSIFSSVGTVILTVSILIIGGILSFYGKISVYEIYSLTLIIPKVSNGFFKLPEIKNSKSELNGIWSLLDSYMAEPINIKKPFDENISNIEIKNLSFGYEEEKNIINNISFCFFPGEHIGIFGRSGKGKSTLIKILLGFWDTKDAIFINGKDLHGINKKDYLKNISYVGQTGYLIDGSILKNITLDSQKSSDINDILKMVNLQDRISNFSDGLLENVSGLSSGEKQKVCIARAIYQDKSVIILDEAISAIDEPLQEIIMNSLNNLKEEGKTVISISHNKKWLSIYDKVLYL